MYWSIRRWSVAASVWTYDFEPNDEHSPRELAVPAQVERRLTVARSHAIQMVMITWITTCTSTAPTRPMWSRINVTKRPKRLSTFGPICQTL